MDYIQGTDKKIFGNPRNRPGIKGNLYLLLQNQDNKGRSFQSPRSNSIVISIINPSPTPELKVDPPSGVILWGDTLLITCSSNGNHMEKSFHFYKDGTELAATNQESLKCSKGPGGAPSNDSLSICLQAQPNHTGEYTCRYEESMSGRWTMSPWSQKVNVTVSSMIQNSYIPWWAVRFLILLMIPFLFCFMRKVNEPSKEDQEELESGERESIPLQSRGSQTFPITEPSRRLPPPPAPQTPNRVSDLPAEP
ncbi:uncharacterized protein LOC134292408 [Anolis carolinensis]|uniref:uncharacterized protein LOC134292408 n=1 Tax=Anolis carolinensis TaxID=28377 RepID=UPI002F2B2556